MRTMVAVAVACIVSVTTARADPPSGFDPPPQVLSRGTLPEFKVKVKGAIDFEAESEELMDIVVRRHDYLPGARTGWHQHPGPVFITVTKGTLTVYEYGDTTCTGIPVIAGEGTSTTGTGTSS